MWVNGVSRDDRPAWFTEVRDGHPFAGRDALLRDGFRKFTYNGGAGFRLFLRAGDHAGALPVTWLRGLFGTELS